MPLLIALLMLVAVLSLGVILGVVGLLRRPFQSPAWRPLLGWPLTVRAVFLVIGATLFLGVLALRHAELVPDAAIGLLAGLVLGGGSASTAQVERRGRLVQHRPNRLFFLLMALAIILRSALSMIAGFAALPHAVDATLPMLGGLLTGYPLAQSIGLRMRLRRACAVRTQSAR